MLQKLQILSFSKKVEPKNVVLTKNKKSNQVIQQDTTVKKDYKQ